MHELAVLTSLWKNATDFLLDHRRHPGQYLMSCTSNTVERSKEEEKRGKWQRNNLQQIGIWAVLAKLGDNHRKLE